MIYNQDRHNGNILLKTSKDIDGIVMYIIDQSHVFNLKHAWDKEKLEKLINDQDYKDEEIMKLNMDELYSMFYEFGIVTEEALKKEADKFKELLSVEKLNEIINDIPAKWSIPAEDLEALKEYILYRLNHIDDMIELIVNYKK